MEVCHQGKYSIFFLKSDFLCVSVKKSRWYPCLHVFLSEEWGGAVLGAISFSYLSHLGYK